MNEIKEVNDVEKVYNDLKNLYRLTVVNEVQTSTKNIIGESSKEIKDEIKKNHSSSKSNFNFLVQEINRFKKQLESLNDDNFDAKEEIIEELEKISLVDKEIIDDIKKCNSNILRKIENIDSENKEVNKLIVDLEKTIQSNKEMFLETVKINQEAVSTELDQLSKKQDEIFKQITENNRDNNKILFISFGVIITVLQIVIIILMFL